jgi:hypothetical protein
MAVACPAYSFRASSIRISQGRVEILQSASSKIFTWNSGARSVIQGIDKDGEKGSGEVKRE